MPIHLRAEPGDYAPAVLCPGDPRRAQHIATTFFDDARLVNEERGLLGYTGTFQGRPISVQTSGMAARAPPSSTRSWCNWATKLIRVGTCGALQPHMAMADLVVGMASTPSDQTVLTYTGGEPHAPSPIGAS